MKAIKELILNKNFWVFALVMHAMVLTALYLRSGINFSNESEKYLAIAGRLNFGNYREELQFLWAYSSYILFLSVCLKMGFSVYVILALQYLISMIGFYLFYRFILTQSFFQKVYARICFLIMITCPLIIYWQLTFYTEIFFIALVMISTYCIFKPKTDRALIIFLLIALVFCRPVGVFYAITLLYVLLKRRGLKFGSLFLYSGFIGVFVLVIFFLPIHYTDFALPVFQGSVICGFPGYPDSVLKEADYTLIEIHTFFIIDHGFWEFLTLSFKKALIFFTVTRPYYSGTHNLFNGVYYVFILGGVIGILRERTHFLFQRYFISILAGSLLIVVLIYNEWSERFIVPLLPFFILSTFILLSNLRTKQTV